MGDGSSGSAAESGQNIACCVCTCIYTGRVGRTSCEGHTDVQVFSREIHSFVIYQEVWYYLAVIGELLMLFGVYVIRLSGLCCRITLFFFFSPRLRPEDIFFIDF